MADNFSVNVNGAARILQKVEGLAAFLKDPKDTLEEIGDYGVGEVDQQFETEGSRLDRRWKKLAKETARQKAMLGFGGKKILERTGALRASVVKEVARFKVEIKSNVSYAAYHQLGMGHNPVRKIFATPDNFRQDVVEFINKGIRSKIAQ